MRLENILYDETAYGFKINWKWKRSLIYGPQLNTNLPFVAKLQEWPEIHEQ